MNTTTICLVAAATVAPLAIKEGITKYSALRRRRAAEQGEAQLRLDRLVTALNDLSGNFATSPAERQREEDAKNLLAGTLKACEAIAAAVGELKGEVSTLRAVISNPQPAAYPEDALQKPDPKLDEINAMTFEHIVRGLSPEEARQRAEDEDEKKTMLSAVSLGI